MRTMNEWEYRHDNPLCIESIDVLLAGSFSSLCYRVRTEVWSDAASVGGSGAYHVDSREKNVQDKCEA